MAIVSVPQRPYFCRVTSRYESNPAAWEAALEIWATALARRVGSGEGGRRHGDPSPSHRGGGDL